MYSLRSDTKNSNNNKINLKSTQPETELKVIFKVIVGQRMEKTSLPDTESK